MRLAELKAGSAPDLVAVGTKIDVQVRSVALDSRRVQPGDIFVAVRGQEFDGHGFIEDALARGAVAIIGSEQGALNDLPVPAFHHPNPRKVLGPMASQLCGYPSRSVNTVGITGTNGKTTTLTLLAAIENARGGHIGTIGTLGASISGKAAATHLTTPEAPDIQNLLAKMRDDGCRSCIMEVSSHGVATDRVLGIDFCVTAFTNLTHDHLDFHNTMEEYGETKARLLLELQPKAAGSRGAVLNFDDEFAAALAPRMGALGLPFFGVSTTGQPGARGRTDHIKLTSDGIEGEIILDDQKLAFTSQLLGRHNLENILMAAAAGHLLGASSEAIVQGIASAGRVAGRLEPVPNPGSFLVLVDYAHTPDALRRILQEVSTFTDGSVICVFGCGGDRDLSKRAEMGRVAAEGAEIVVVTSDNPRTEDPQKIIDEILKGVDTSKTEQIVEVDREVAIRRALSMATDTDTVLIAGKGHEDYQIIGTRRRDFSDHAIASHALNRDRDLGGEPEGDAS